MLTPNFSLRELSCRCGCTTPEGVTHNLRELAQQLEQLRALVGKPVVILSGYRCPEHNRKVDGAPMSQHTLGLAADVMVKGMTPGQIKRAAERVARFNAGGIGLYRTWVHVDIRGTHARWNG